jgi:hypothetical protein
MVMTIALAAVLAALLSACTTGTSVSSKPSATPSAVPSVSGSGSRVAGVATAGPVCPVERPGDSACAPRVVAGATLVVTSTAGSEVVRVRTGADGRFELSLPAGAYILVPQPVDGLMGTAPSIPFSVDAAGAPSPTRLQVQYDTGIR